MTRLNGRLRFKISIEWINRGKPTDLEEFIKKACNALNIEYVPPKKYRKVLTSKEHKSTIKDTIQRTSAHKS